jgi:hypothetical protein
MLKAYGSGMSLWGQVLRGWGSGESPNPMKGVGHNYSKKDLANLVSDGHHEAGVVVVVVVLAIQMRFMWMPAWPLR